MTGTGRRGGVGSAILRLTALRALLMGLALVPARLLVADWLLAVAIAFLVSAIAGIPLLAAARRRVADVAAPGSRRPPTDFPPRSGRNLPGHGEP